MANEYLKRTPTSTGNRKVFTWSGWVKSNIDNAPANGNAVFMCAAENDGNLYYRTRLGRYVVNEGDFGFNHYDGANDNYGTQALNRDHSNWEHYICAVDTTQEQTTDRVKLYLNGVYQSDLTTVVAIDKDLDTFMNGNSIHFVGADSWTATPNSYSKLLMSDVFFIDGQALTPDVFGFYKEGDGYVSAGSTQATDFRPGQWVPKRPRIIKTEIERRGGFGVNGFYLPMNDSSNPGADFHCDPNSIITLKGEDLPQPRNGAPTTSDAYVSQLRQEAGTLGFDGVVKFDGNGDYLSLSTTSDFAFGTGDFTVEFWAWIESSQSSTLQPIFDNDYNSAGGIAIAIRHSDSKIFVGDNGSGLNLCQFNAPFALNSWNHFAVVAHSGTYKAFVNGVACSLALGSTTVVNTSKSSGTTEIGRLVGQTSIDAQCFISNLRVVKGTAVYTTNYTAPTEPLTNVTNTVLLCCNSSTSATAATVTPGTITANGDVLATRNELTGSIVLAVPGISTSTSANIVSNGHFDTNTTGWTVGTADGTLVARDGELEIQRVSTNGTFCYQQITTEAGKRYTVSFETRSSTISQITKFQVGTSINGSELLDRIDTTSTDMVHQTASFTATGTTTYVTLGSNYTANSFWNNIVVKQEDAPRDYSADIKGSGTNKTFTPNGGAGVGYELGGYYGSAMILPNGNSVLGDDRLLVTDNDLAMGTGDFTVEVWINPDAIYDYLTIFATRPTQGAYTDGFNLWINAGGATGVYSNAFLTQTANGTINPNQWTHVVAERYNGTLTTYVNGVAAAVQASNTQDYTRTAASIGQLVSQNVEAFTGQMQDLRVYKGVAKYKGGFDVPKPYTPVGFESWRTTADTCKNNFATLNPLVKSQFSSGDRTLSNGNLTATTISTGSANNLLSTIGVSSGKWYIEVYVSETTISTVGFIGVTGIGENNNQNNDTAGDHIYYYGTAQKFDYVAGSLTSSSYGSTYTAGDLISVLINADNGEVTFYKNNVSQGVAKTFPTSQFPLLLHLSDGGSNATATYNVNFGQNPSFSGQVTAGTNADDSGKGLFKYAPPSGFLALCEDNLPTPAIADPGGHFKTLLYTGDGNSSRGITGLGFQPDLVWIKERTSTSGHIWFDSVRGADKYLFSVLTNAEGDAGGGVISFDSDGYSIGNNGAVNQSGEDYVSWCWKAGGAAVSNTDGTITSQVSANQTAGFSIVSYTANGTDNATVGHGLGKVPDLIIVKNRDGAVSWGVWHSSLTSGQVLRLNEDTEAQSPATAYFQDENNTSSVFALGTNDETNDDDGDTYIAYCWAEIEGYSKFGRWYGNGDPDGPFVYCGFKPAFIMSKRTDSATNGNWTVFDSSRDSTNPVGAHFRADATNEELFFGSGIDIVSNGFKIREAASAINNGSGTYIFMAFAESPFKTANAK